MAAAGNSRTPLASLRGRPEKLRVALSDDSVTVVAVPNVKRWKARASAVVDSMPWVWLEPLGAKDEVVGPRVENQEPSAGDLEDLELDTGRHESVTAMLSLMLRAQDVALCRQAQAYNAMLENNQQLLQTVSGRLAASERHLSEMFEQMMAMRRQLVAGVEEGSSDEAMAVEILKLAAKSQPQVRADNGQKKGK